MSTNAHVIFVKRPGVDGAPADDNFGFEECPFPPDPEPGEILIKTLYLSVDPALRCRMNEKTGADYLTPWKIGEEAGGFGGLGQVIKSADPEFSPGDILESQFGWPWVAYFKQRQNKQTPLRKLDTALLGGNLTLPLTVLGMIGLTSYLGVKEKGGIKLGHNQAMVVSGAAGACGSIAGQLGRLEGCTTVVGICGSVEKCKVLTEELGFDAAINYKTEDVKEKLAELCPCGVDVYFDNVGGEISNTVINQMNKDSNVILCGQIAVYNQDLPYPPPIPESIESRLKELNISRTRFLVLNYVEKFEESLKKLAELVLSGKLKVRETTMEGLENTGKAFVSMMNGGNIGKQLVHVADP
ncbi:prostaglandin reductase 2-like [Ostrea edulis]|uniref:prostaglandin reductase 2-like n=1 Tax=Ostrea edulis TaxID=37623 RepID=UPI0024AF4BD5|nr:prostaglandin reductase 2-like [Ostrea edulis]